MSAVYLLTRTNEIYLASDGMVMDGTNGMPARLDAKKIITSGNLGFLVIGLWNPKIKELYQLTADRTDTPRQAADSLQMTFRHYFKDHPGMLNDSGGRLLVFIAGFDEQGRPDVYKIDSYDGHELTPERITQPGLATGFFNHPPDVEVPHNMAERMLVIGEDHQDLFRGFKDAFKEHIDRYRQYGANVGGQLYTEILRSPKHKM